jgi:phosphoribosylaminoimidazole synthetase
MYIESGRKIKMKDSAYKNAGVDIDAGNEFVDNIKGAVQRTDRSGVMGTIGAFGGLFDLKEAGYVDPILVSATDGVGTKLKIAIETNKHRTVGIDLVAMCVNDLIVQGAEPLFFLDYFATGKLQVYRAIDVVDGISEGCVQAGCCLIGGETAEMPGMYQGDDYDLAGFSVGAVERENVIDGRSVCEGDVILGLASNGLHSNGYSLVRHILNRKNIGFNDPCPYQPDVSFCDELLSPTRIYVKPLLSLMKSAPGVIKGLAHITGGGITENVPRILPEKVNAVIKQDSWELPDIFKWLQMEGGLSEDDMLSTFNCGIGMVVICSSSHRTVVEDHLKAQGETVYDLGRIEKSDLDKGVVRYK